MTLIYFKENHNVNQDFVKPTKHVIEQPIWNKDFT